MYKSYTFTSQLKLVIKDIDAESAARVRGGAVVAAKVMRKNANKKGESTPGGFPAKQTGRFKKSLGYRLDKSDFTAVVGSRSGLTHLLEYGWGDGKSNNKRPIIRPSLLEAEDEIIRVMSEKFW